MIVDSYSKEVWRDTRWPHDDVPIADLLGPTPDDLKPLVHEVKTRLEKLGNDILIGYYELGRVINDTLKQLHANLTAEQREDSCAEIMQRLGVESDVNPRTLYDCLRREDVFA